MNIIQFFMGNNINFCGIVSISEEGRIYSTQINRNTCIRHYDEPNILLNPNQNLQLQNVQNVYIIEDRESLTIEYQMITNKDTEIEGLEKTQTFTDKNTHNFSKFFCSNAEKNEIMVDGDMKANTYQ